MGQARSSDDCVGGRQVREGMPKSEGEIVTSRLFTAYYLEVLEVSLPAMKLHLGSTDMPEFSEIWSTADIDMICPGLFSMVCFPALERFSFFLA